MIAEAAFSGANIISINVSVLDDGLVELPESFFLTGRVVEEDIPVVFGDVLEVSIISDESTFKENCSGICLLHAYIICI